MFVGIVDGVGDELLVVDLLGCEDVWVVEVVLVFVGDW